jgi:hypothetical protein
VNTAWCSSIDAALLQRDRGRIASGHPNIRRPVSLVAGTALAVISSAPVEAQQTPEAISLPAVAVTAPATASLKTTLSPAADALPAETTTLGPEVIEREPIFSYGDIFRPLTGFDVSNLRSRRPRLWDFATRFHRCRARPRHRLFHRQCPSQRRLEHPHSELRRSGILIPETVRQIDIIR